MFICNSLLVTINNLQFLSATLLFPKLILLGKSLAPLANTSNGNCYGGSIGVTAGVGYRVGEIIGG
jgi:hypothetical protein